MNQMCKYISFRKSVFLLTRLCLMLTCGSEAPDLKCRPTHQNSFPCTKQNPACSSLLLPRTKRGKQQQLLSSSQSLGGLPPSLSIIFHMNLKIRGPSKVYVLIVILCMHRNDLLVMLQDDSITDPDKSIKLHNISRNYKCDDIFFIN